MKNQEIKGNKENFRNIYENFKGNTKKFKDSNKFNGKIGKLGQNTKNLKNMGIFNKFFRKV